MFGMKKRNVSKLKDINKDIQKNKIKKSKLLTSRKQYLKDPRKLSIINKKIKAINLNIGYENKLKVVHVKYFNNPRSKVAYKQYKQKCKTLEQDYRRSAKAIRKSK
jgi:hypothetical protein